MSNPTVSVVLPCLDEADSVAGCVFEAFRGLARAGLDGEVIVVDNGSVDGSASLAKDAGARVVFESSRGVGYALRTGFRHARGRVVVMADADGTYDLSRLGELVWPVLNGDADMTVGSRLNGGNRGTMPFLHRFLGTPVLSFLLRRACGGMRVRDSQSGYRAMRRDSLRGLDLKATGFEVTSEMLIRGSQHGWRIRETYLGYRPRLGESKLSTLLDGWRHLQLILLLAPQLMLFWPGVVLLSSGIALTVLSLLSPSGFAVGHLRWQPIFFAPILLVLGTMASASAVLISHHSPLLRTSDRRPFGVVRRGGFHRRLVVAGLLLLALGLAIDLVLFVDWVTDGLTGDRALPLAGFAQSCVINGVSLAALGVVYRLLTRQVDYRDRDGDVDILSFEPNESSPDTHDRRLVRA